VNKYAEPAGWGGGGVKKYAALVRIIDLLPEIRSGMNSEVSIHVERRERALTAPVQAVLEHGRKFYCLVKAGDRWETREVTIGANNDQFVTIESGLSESDRVALNPRSYTELLALPAL